MKTSEFEAVGFHIVLLTRSVGKQRSLNTKRSTTQHVLDGVLFSTSVCVCVQSGFRQVKEPSAPRCINKIVFSVLSLPVLV